MITMKIVDQWIDRCATTSDNMGNVHVKRILRWLGQCRRNSDSASQAEILTVMPTYSYVQSQPSRHRQHQCTPVPDPLNIPEALRTTLRGHELLDDDRNYNEQFLLYSGQGGRLLVFCARTELEVLRQSEYSVRWHV